MIPHYDTPWLMITGGDIVLPGGGVLARGTLLINQGKIQEVTDATPASLVLGQNEVTIIDATDCWVTPGLIDQHLHGAFGVDFNQSGLDDIHELLTVLPHKGITTLLPTLITAPKLDLLVSLAKLEEVIQNQVPHQARIFGIHLEGPFLNPEYRGAHPAEDLLRLTENNLEGLISPSLKRLTLAPELDPTGEFIRAFRQDNILCSIGHSGADYVTAMTACKAGATCATHLFNAMGRLDHRNPGILVASLVNDEMYVELIADGHHLSPPVVEMTLKTKPFEKTILISDCNALTGMPSGSSFRFGKQSITMKAHGAVNEEGRLAGSTAFITDCVRNIAQWGLLSFPDAVQLATYHPAQHLGATPKLGQIVPGATADLILWHKDDLSISTVFLAGQELPELSPTGKLKMAMA